MPAVAPLLCLAVSTAVRLLAGLVQLKYLAWQFGPASFGLLTQIMGIAAIFYMLAGGAVSWGLIRNIAAARSGEERERWMSAGSTINLLASVGLVFIALLLWRFDAGAMFHDPGYTPGYTWVYPGIAVAQAMVGLGNLILAYHSGVGNVRTFAAVNIAASMLALAMVIGLGLGLGLGGAVAGLAFSPAMLGAIALCALPRGEHGRALLRISWDWKAMRNLISYAAVLAVSAAAIPAAQLLIRADMGERLGWDYVGYWQAVAKISDAYMVFIGVAFVNDLLPQLSRRHAAADALGVLWRFDIPLLAGFAVICGAIYGFRDVVLPAVYSERFLPAADFVLPQLAGDALRVAALSLSYYFISRGRLVIASCSELARGVALYAFYRLLTAPYGAAAALYAHVATCALFLVAMLALLKMPAAAPRAGAVAPPFSG